jgi:peptidoglycan/LPS O-acetylase OafA/YrhL
MYASTVKDPHLKKDALIENGQYFGLFDLLRAILAFTVFAAHSHLLPAQAAPLGSYAVEIFFALSGFLVGGILINNATQPLYWQNLPKFYFNRCLRIWIPYYLLILSYIGLVTLRGQWSDDLELRLIPLLTYTHNWSNDVIGLSSSLAPINHAWSLAVEEQFYLLCPLIIGLVKNRIFIIMLMAALFAVLPFQFSTTYYAAICLGVLAAAAHQSLPNLHWIKISWIALIFGLAGIMILAWNGCTTDSILVSCCAALIVIGLSRYHRKRPLFYLLGAMSYSFYLFHWIGLYLANPISKLVPQAYATPIKALIGFGLALAISYGSVKLIEWPLIKRRETLAARYPWLLYLITVVAFLLTSFGAIWLASYYTEHG